MYTVERSEFRVTFRVGSEVMCWTFWKRDLSFALDFVRKAVHEQYGQYPEIINTDILQSRTFDLHD